MSIFEGMNGPLFPVDAALDDEGPRRGRGGKRKFLMGVPLGAMYPPGLFPVDGYDEADEDPNP